MEYLINWGCVYPLYYCRVGPGAPLEYLQAVLHAIVVVYIWLPLYVKLLHAVASKG